MFQNLIIEGEGSVEAEMYFEGIHYQFSSIKEILAKASEAKSGDILAGIAATSSLERMAVKVVLSELTLKDIYEFPVIPYEEDEITRIIYDDISLPIYKQMQNWTVGEIRNHILSFETEQM